MGEGREFFQAILLFMLVCVLTFVFFKRRGEDPEKTMAQKLLKAACKKIEKYLQKNGTITTEAMEKQLKGLTVRDSWLRKNMRIDDPKLYAKGLTRYMLEQQIIAYDGKNGYRLKEEKTEDK
ncbi:MAG: hypothetical protein IJA51_06425 [Oscillospiraceae bacterium]|nr:hypothetical protein [Oscillospiraceae bacterium]